MLQGEALQKEQTVYYHIYMPAKNSSKEYLKNGYYHIYNRGVEKRIIFSDEQDYGVFLSYLKEYLLPKNVLELQKKLTDPDVSYFEKDKIAKLLRLNNFSGEISLLAYCLMPNHFHFLIKQQGANSIDNFMNSLATRYVVYFNRKNKRVGPLFQGVYKAILISTDEQFLHLSRYIHQQAINTQNREQPSSYFDYLGKRKTTWLNTEEILSFFSQNHPHLSYESFVRERDNELIKSFLIENEN